MGGFGSDPFGFGRSPFGYWDWSAYVLHKLSPDIYRQFDPDNDYAFLKYAKGLRGSFDQLRTKIRNFSDLRDPLKVRTQYDGVITLRLGPEVLTLGELEQRGIDGTVSVLQEFTTPTGRFAFDDIGKEIEVTGSTILANNRRVTIIRVLTQNTVLTEPPLVGPDAVPFKWELHAAVARDPTMRTVRVQSGSVDQIALGWFLTDGLGSYEVIGRRHFVWDDPIRKSFAEQDGEGAYFDLSGNLVVPSGQFTPVNLGQKVLTNGTNDDNLGVWEIAAISVGGPPWTLTLVQSGDRIPDQNPYYWALLPREELDLRAVPQPHGVALKSGQQGSVAAFPTQFVAVDGLFDSQDAAPVNYLTVQGSALGNDGIYEVTGVILPSTLVVSPAFPGGPEGGLFWALRKGTLIGDKTQVQVSAESMITELVQDFGITVDTRESEYLQRSNADHVGRWVNIKGIEKAYEVLGALTGMIVDVDKLWRVSQETFLWLQGAGYGSTLLEAGDAVAGRVGQTGGLTLQGGRVHLTDAAAAFIPGDVGFVVRVSNTSTLANSKLYTIDEYVSPTEVAFRLVYDTAITPDYGTGGSSTDPKVHWFIERLYTTLEPRRPYMDDFNSDLLTEIVNAVAPPTDTFSLDRYCWEPDFSTTVPVVFVGVAPVTGQYLWQVTVQTPGGQPGSAEVIYNPQHWVFVDANGEEYGIETVPVSVGPSLWAFTVFGVAAPTLVGVNPTYLYYDCPLVLSCDFCSSHWIYAKIDYGPDLAPLIGPPVENIYTRTLERIEQVKPAHVRIIVREVRQIEATLNLTASIETHPWLAAILVAPVSAYYDELPADVTPVDTYLFASIEADVQPLSVLLDAPLAPSFDDFPADSFDLDDTLAASIETP